MAPPATTVNVALGFGTALVTVLGLVLLKRLLDSNFPSNWQLVGTVKELFIYPLKSGRGTSSESLFVTNKGVKEVHKKDRSFELRDRSFLIYTSKDKEVRTARQIPKSVQISIQAADNGIILSAPHKVDLYINIPKVKNDTAVTFGSEPFTCTDCGESAAKWLSNFLLDKNEGLRLGYGDGSRFRNVLRDHKKWAEYYTNMDNYMSGIFSDLAALHLINDATVENLNEKLAAENKITVRNFRPNILIEGPEAFAEDQYKFVKIGGVVAKVCLECLRCIESTVSPNGEMNKEREPIKTLEAYRKSKGPFHYGVMGIYLKVLKTGQIKVGDPVYISK